MRHHRLLTVLCLAGSLWLAHGCAGDGGWSSLPTNTGELVLQVAYPEELSGLEGQVASYLVTVTDESGSTQELPPLRVNRAPGQQIFVGPIAVDPENERVTVEAQDSGGQRIGSYEVVTDVHLGAQSLPVTIFSVLQKTAQWVPMGPNGNFDDAVQKTTVSGRIASLAIDPADSRRILAGTAGGGVWLSNDDGNRWTALTDQARSLAIGAVAFDPDDSKLVYAGTGEATVSDALYGFGLLSSDNRGNSFTDMPGTESIFERQAIARIVAWPGQPKRLLLGTYKVPDNANQGQVYGVYESVGGQPFRRIFPAAGSLEVTDLARLSDGSLLVAVRRDLSEPAPANPQVGIFRATLSAGQWTFSPASQGLPAGTGRIELNGRYALVSVTPDANEEDKSEKFLGLFQWGGQSWSRVNATVTYTNDDGKAETSDLRTALGGQSDYNMAVVMDPNNSLRVYAAGDTRILRVEVNSLDPAQSTALALPTRTNSTPHPDIHCLMVDSRGDLLVGCDGGLWRLPSPAQATALSAWQNLNGLPGQALETIQHTGVSLHPKDPKIITSGSQDNGTSLTLNNRVWRIFATGDGGYARFDPVLDRVSYQTYQRTAKAIDQHTDATRFLARIERSADDTKIVATDISDGIPPRDESNFYVPIQVVRDGTGRRLAAGTVKVYERTDADSQFRPVSANLIYSVDALAYAPHEPRVLYAAAQGKMFVRHGEASQLTAAAGAGLPDSRQLKYLAVSPQEAGTVYAVYNEFNANQRVYRSDDYGANWTNITGKLENRPINGVLIDPAFQGGGLFVATDRGVFVTTDNGKNWSPFGQGLPNAQLMELASVNGVLAVATHGRGVWAVQTRVGAAAVSSPTASPLLPILPKDAPGLSRKGIKRVHQGPLSSSSL